MVREFTEFWHQSEDFKVCGLGYGLRFVIVLDSILKVFIIRTYVFAKSKTLGRKGVYKRRKDSPGIYIYASFYMHLHMYTYILDHRTASEGSAREQLSAKGGASGVFRKTRSNNKKK